MNDRLKDKKHIIHDISNEELLYLTKERAKTFIKNLESKNFDPYITEKSSKLLQSILYNLDPILNDLKDISLKVQR